MKKDKIKEKTKLVVNLSKLDRALLITILVAVIIVSASLTTQQEENNNIITIPENIHQIPYWNVTIPYNNTNVTLPPFIFIISEE